MSGWLRVIGLGPGAPDLLAPESGGAGSGFHPDRAIGPATSQSTHR